MTSVSRLHLSLLSQTFYFCISTADRANIECWYANRFDAFWLQLNNTLILTLVKIWMTIVHHLKVIRTVSTVYVMWINSRKLTGIDQNNICTILIMISDLVLSFNCFSIPHFHGFKQTSTDLILSAKQSSLRFILHWISQRQSTATCIYCIPILAIKQLSLPSTNKYNFCNWSRIWDQTWYTPLKFNAFTHLLNGESCRRFPNKQVCLFDLWVWMHEMPISIT